MAYYGHLNTIKQQVVYPRFEEAFEYLTKIFEQDSIEQKRLLSYPIDSFVKVNLNESLFALEQVYKSKYREKCFFESHRHYIDIQLILEGEEYIDVGAISGLKIDVPYDHEKDIIKYCDIQPNSSFLLRKGDVAIFFPEDAHMPCLKTDQMTMVYKTVVKVPVIHD